MNRHRFVAMSFIAAIFALVVLLIVIAVNFTNAVTGPERARQVVFAVANAQISDYEDTMGELFKLHQALVVNNDPKEAERLLVTRIMQQIQVGKEYKGILQNIVPGIGNLCERIDNVVSNANMVLQR